jgi:hypothetical protein
LKKRLETHLSKCIGATPSEEMFVTNTVWQMEGELDKKQSEDSHEDWDPPVHKWKEPDYKSWEEQAAARIAAN